MFYGANFWFAVTFFTFILFVVMFLNNSIKQAIYSHRNNMIAQFDNLNQLIKSKQLELDEINGQVNGLHSKRKDVLYSQSKQIEKLTSGHLEELKKVDYNKAVLMKKHEMLWQEKLNMYKIDSTLKGVFVMIKNKYKDIDRKET